MDSNYQGAVPWLTPLLSVVLTTRTTDRLNDLYELLDSLKAQSYKNIEVVFLAEKLTELMDKVRECSGYNSFWKKKFLQLDLSYGGNEVGCSMEQQMIVRAKKPV